MEYYYLRKQDAAYQLILAAREIPRPQLGQVLVRMRAASLNYRDLLVIGGRYRGMRNDLIPLSDGSGEVVEVGSEVAGWNVGDRVVGTFYPTWLTGPMRPDDASKSLGCDLHGILCQYKIFNADELVRIPDFLSFEKAATLPCAALTAWNALFGARPVQSGESVLLLGTGGVSMFALQFTAAVGARAIVISSSDSKLEEARRHGASECINYNLYSAWQKEVLRLTDGQGVDHVVEVGGAGTLQKSLASVRFGGWIHLIGVLTTGKFNPMPILTKTATVRGILVGSRQMFKQMNDIITEHQIEPVLHKIFSFGEITQAYSALEQASHVGKIVVRID